MKRMIQLTMMACIAMICVCFASCNDDAIVEVSQSNETSQPFRLTASQATPSRLALGEDGLSVMWEPGDKLYLVKKDRSTAPIELIADIEEAATEATFTSQSGVPAGEYHVVYNYNDDLVYEHVPFMSIDDINEQDKLALWGELTVSEGDTSAEITLQHIYAKIRVELKNAPESDCFQIGMYASGKNGFPKYRILTNDGLVDAAYEPSKYYQTNNIKSHHIYLGDFTYKFTDTVDGQNYNTEREELEKRSSLILPTDVSDGKLFFYIINSNINEKQLCYEIAKENIKFEAGKSYKVSLDMSEKAATITELLTQSVYFPEESDERTVYQLSSPEEFRHAAYRGINRHGFELRYILTENIDFSNDIFLPFQAEYLLGNDKTISNISLDWSNDDNVGLVRYEEDKPLNYHAVISNLTLENVSFKGNNYVGALGGYNIIAKDCKVTGNSEINGNDFIGGTIGYNAIDVKYWVEEGGISNISIDGACLIQGKNYVGGIIGYNSWNHSCSFSFKLLESCVSSANIIARGDFVGGIVGKIAEGKYDEPYSIRFSSEGLTYSLSNCVNYGIVTGADYVGGIVGDFAVYTNAEGQDRVVIKQSANEGKVNGSNYVGGIAGRTYASINTCYSVNEISATGSHVGGIVGEDYPMNGRIANCYSLADISVGENGYAGGIVGYGSGGAKGSYVINSYFAGTNPNGYGIIGWSEGSCSAINCLTTTSSLIGNTERENSIDYPDNTSGSLVNVKSIEENKSVINGESAYSDDIWSLEDYPAYCLKFSTGFSGGIIVPGFGNSEIEI